MGVSVLFGRGSRGAGASGASAERGARGDERVAGVGEICGGATVEQRSETGKMDLIPDDLHRLQAEVLRGANGAPLRMTSYFSLLNDQTIALSTVESAVAAGFVADGGAGHAVFHPAETAAEALGELMTSAPEAGLQRVFRNAKFLGRFSGGIAFDFAEYKSGPQQGRKFVEIFVDDFANFRSGIDLLGRWAIVGESLGGRQFVLVTRFVERNRGASLGAAALH